MERQSFMELATRALEHIDRELGDLEHEDLDLDLGGDVLTIAFEDGAKFIINAHSSALQVWMAAGTTAWHFDWEEDRGEWIARKNGDELMRTTARVVGEKLGQEIRL